MQLTLDQATGLCRMAALGAGANEEATQSLVASIIAAEAEGLSAVGLSHFIDYLEAIQDGRIDGNADPVVTRPALAVYLSDARGGLAHTGFDRTIDDLASGKLFGVAIFSQKNAYTCGALGYFTGRLAGQGLVSFAATNGPAVLAGSGSVKPVYCTNPMSFAAPAADGPPLIIDQSSSATAFVNIRKAAEDGKKIPEGWALDASGNPTTDPAAAMKGAMLAFGGQRGANIALMVEVLAAGISGANWSIDAPWFSGGPDSPGTGLFVLAVEPKLLDPDFERRMKAQLDRLRRRYGVHIPGRARAEAAEKATARGFDVPKAVVQRISEFAERYSA
ncbi:lactate dehydrogenase [Mesorhizobium loti]|uniref:Lactate dehydrogenase n=1 Tax=Rhizobium loti TaxID=381 RepID=A0A101KS17_RHILI|nr:lactate dehydrogenase [Mesorhizobium loti]